MDWKSQYPLHASCCEGTFEVAQSLLNSGADVNQADDDDSGNWTPLHYASWYHHPNIVSLLLESGVNVNAPNASKATPLHYAAGCGHLDIVKLLVEAGADKNAPNADKQTPAALAKDIKEGVRLTMEPNEIALLWQSPDVYKNKKMLAPLVGGSDLSYRLLCREYGADVTFTEMCIAEYHLQRFKKKVKQYTFEFDVADRPLIAQLGGNVAAPIIELANSELFKGHIDGIDLNCGCPQGFAMEKGYGSALLRDPEHLVDMCRQIAQSIAYPLSVKMRLHDDVPTTIGIVDKLTQVGVKAITVHGRYWWQKGDNRGRADWNAVAEIRSKFPNLPIIGNGDVMNYNDFDRFRAQSDVDSAMVGYGALLNPSVFSPEPDSLSNMISKYLTIARQHENRLVDIQRHIAWMVKRHTPATTKAYLALTPDVSELLGSLETPIVVTLADFDSAKSKVKAPLGADSTALSEADRIKLQKRAHRKAKKNKKIKDMSPKPANGEEEEEFEFGLLQDEES